MNSTHRTYRQCDFLASQPDVLPAPTESKRRELDAHMRDLAARLGRELTADSIEHEGRPVR